MSDEKWRTFIIFTVQGTGRSSTVPGPENRVGDKDSGSPGRPDSSGLQVSRGIVEQEKHTYVDLTAAGVFPSKCPSVAPAEMSNTPH